MNPYGTFSMCRRICAQHGLPITNTYMENWNIFYNAQNKTWKCMICGKVVNKYDWAQITNCINAKHHVE